jgi:hypothetical protein
MGQLMDLKLYGKQLFGQITNCLPPEKGDADYFTIGEARLCDVEEYVSQFMKMWVNQPSFAPAGFANFTTLQKQELYKNRFCTPEEYMLLFTAPQGRLETPVFILLGITNEQERTKYRNLFTANREGYFKLMQIFNTPLKSFFFPAIHS